MEDWTQALNEMIAAQHQKLAAYGREIVPTLTLDDLLQPNDFPELERDPVFRYEEGILAGLLSVQAMLRARFSSSVKEKDL